MRGGGTVSAMRYFNAVSPIVFAFLCGYNLPRLARKIDTGAGIHSATDLAEWLVVLVAGLVAIHGAWRAVRSARDSQTSR